MCYEIAVKQISSDWSYVANVIDRLVLIIFTMGSATRPLSGDTFESAFDVNFTQESWWKNSGGL
ncbi:hypothetical protein NECAME_16718 [Necator americanus]|uniref:Uncharacterized protein n=1 Tax=Necator americanus TaxID=51031 RepID=W2TU39_NECAM|nr:hypothetical protein NECAME_16718 [Necator americanus]ETN85605.1 hypothetical protein NECAME_16718 [Necator americanus]